jgi:hypothetical protein
VLAPVSAHGAANESKLRLGVHDALDGAEQVKGAAREAVNARHRRPNGSVILTDGIAQAFLVDLDLRLNATTGRARGAASTASKIESNVTFGLAAADQEITCGRRLDWVRPVGDGAGNQPRLAVVTNSGAARPAHRHIARLG